MTQKYQLTEVELNLLWEMSRMTKEKEVFQISTNVKTFELILNDLEKIDEERLDALVTLREKLNFNSDNPKLIVTTSRQLAVGTELKISGKISGQTKQLEFQAVAQLNTPNYLFVKVMDEGEVVKIDKLSSLTVKFRPLRQKMVYQFHATLQNTGANSLLRIEHSNKVKIVEEL
jgi:hypothetical protein